MNRFLLVIIGAAGVTFAPTTFDSETACKTTARVIAERAASAVSNGGGPVTLACIPVEREQ